MSSLSVATSQRPPIELNEVAKSQHVEVPCSTTLAVDTRYPHGWKLGLVILPLCLGTLLVAIDNTIIAVAIPKIVSTFKALD